LALHNLLNKSLPTNISSRNTGTSLPGHTQRCLALIPLLSNIVSTPSQISHLSIKNNVHYTHQKLRPSKLKLTNYALQGSSTPLHIHHGSPSLPLSTKNRALSTSVRIFTISIMHVPRTTFQRPLSTKLSMIAPVMKPCLSWMISLDTTKFKFTQTISTKPHLLPHGELLRIMS
jgi:hypothetical protein